MPSYFGVYRALVVDTNDPLNERRLKVTIPAIGVVSVVWALPCVPAGSQTVPFIGDTVWLSFEAGDVASPVWLGVFRSAGGWPSNNSDVPPP